MTIFLPALLLGAVVIWFIAIYNRFIRLQNMVQEAWSGIDVQLKRRHDLIPNIVETVKGYTGHEKTVLEDVSALRAGNLHSADAKQRGEAENALTQSLKNLFAIAEAYPNLKADKQFLQLQDTLIDIEDQIQYARRYYNGSVRNYNILIQSFPSNLIAGLCNYRTREYFEIDLITERNVPNVGAF